MTSTTLPSTTKSLLSALSTPSPLPLLPPLLLALSKAAPAAAANDDSDQPTAIQDDLSMAFLAVQSAARAVTSGRPRRPRPKGWEAEHRGGNPDAGQDAKNFAGTGSPRTTNASLGEAELSVLAHCLRTALELARAARVAGRRAEKAKEEVRVREEQRDEGRVQERTA
jgi:hypothetical protein